MRIMSRSLPSRCNGLGGVQTMSARVENEGSFELMTRLEISNEMPIRS